MDAYGPLARHTGFVLTYYISIAMLWEAFRWSVNVLEVIVVIAAILVVGLTSTVILLRILGRLAGPPVGLSPDPDEMAGGMAGKEPPIPPDDASASPK